MCYTPGRAPPNAGWWSEPTNGEQDAGDQPGHAVRRRLRPASEWGIDAGFRLGGELALPLIAKATIKDALMSVLPVPDIETSRHLSRAAVAAMLAIAAQAPLEQWSREQLLSVGRR